MENMNEIFRQSASENVLEKYLTFQIDGRYYGISIANVIEIVQLQPVTELPELPNYAKGVINLRGRVLPLIDVNLRFGKPERDYTDRTCIVIADIEETHVGLIVDAVDEVLDIEGGLISSPPAFSTDFTSRYVTGIANLERHIILILNCVLLFSDAEMKALAQSAI